MRKFRNVFFNWIDFLVDDAYLTFHKNTYIGFCNGTKNFCLKNNIIRSRVIFTVFLTIS